MHGNAWEWCQDHYDPDYYSHSPKQNPPGGTGGDRVFRGGAWDNPPAICRCAFRNHNDPGHRHSHVGFRVVLARVPVGKEIVKVAPEKPTFKNKVGIEFVLIPKGKSWLGGGGGKPGTKEVEILHDFYLGKYEVTQGEWQKVMRNNTNWFGRFGKGKDIVKNIPDDELKRFPVESLSWFDAQRFVEELNKLAKETGWVYRLPTEVEWEYACRGGPMRDKGDSAFDFYLDKPLSRLQPEQANFFNEGKGLKRTCKVGSYPANKLGLFDMHGNVWEWCEDEQKLDKGVSGRASRGSSWPHNSGVFPAANRIAIPPSYQANDLGLRLARVPVGKEIVKLAPAGAEPTTKPDRDRQAAAWVLSLGGAVSVHVNRVDRDVRAGGKLPTEAFELRRIDLSSNLYGGNPVVNRALKDDDGLRHLAGLTNLVRIDLHNTTGADAGLAHLKGLTSLRELYLFGCLDVSDAGVAHLKDLTNLRNLDLNATRVTDAGLVHIKGLTNLTSLNLMGTQISGAGFVHLKGLTKLESFALAYSQVEDKGLAHVECLSNVGWLSLEGTRVTDAGLVHLKGLTRLASIFLSGPSVSAAGLVHLKRLPNLTGINLSGAHVNDAWLKQLQGLSKLRILELRDTKVTAEGIAAFKKALPECRVHAKLNQKAKGG
jgi:formylglycine-generating enzyme required for sulfatase activity